MEKIKPTMCDELGCVNEAVYFGKHCWCLEHIPRPTPHQQFSEKGERRTKISKESLIAMRKRLNEKADALLLAKGNDYNAQQQEDGDTLFNLRICSILGIVPSPVDGILVRMSDKLARLVSLTRPSTVQKVANESLEDTVVDLRNYADYLLAMVKESKGEEIS